MNVIKSLNSLFRNKFGYIKPRWALRETVVNKCSTNENWANLTDFEFVHVSNIETLLDNWDGKPVINYSFDNNGFVPQYAEETNIISSDKFDFLSMVHQLYIDCNKDWMVDDENRTRELFASMMSKYNIIASASGEDCGIKKFRYHTQSPHLSFFDQYIGYENQIVIGIECKPVYYFADWNKVISGIGYDLRNLEKYAHSPLKTSEAKSYWATRQMVTYLGRCPFAVLECETGRILFFLSGKTIYYTNYLDSEEIHPILPYLYISTTVVKNLQTLLAPQKYTGKIENNNKKMQDSDKNDDKKENKDKEKKNDNNQGNSKTNNGHQQKLNGNEQTLSLEYIGYADGRTGAGKYKDEKGQEYYGKHLGIWDKKLIEKELNAYERLKKFENIYIPESFVIRTSFGRIFLTKSVKDESITELDIKNLVTLNQLEEWKFKVLSHGKKAIEEFYDHNVLHKDISENNIVITKRGEVKFFDFDEALFKEPNQDNAAFDALLQHDIASFENVAKEIINQMLK